LWLVTAGGEYQTITAGEARLWDLTAADPAASARVLRGHENVIVSTAISPNGRWLVTASWDRTARLWDLTAEDPAASSIVFHGHTDSVTDIAISPESRWLVTAGRDKTVRLLELDVDSLVDRARRLAGRELTPEERNQHQIPLTNASGNGRLSGS